MSARRQASAERARHREITNQAPWLTPETETETETETEFVSTRMGDYQYVSTVGQLPHRLWMH